LSPTECNCTGNLVSISNSNFSSGFNSWVYSPNPFSPGVGGWNLVSNRARATVQENFNSVNTSSVYLSQLNVLNVSCSYEICFQAWSGTPGVTSSFVSIDTGNYTTNLPVVTTPLTTIPTAYTLTISNIQTPNLTFFVASTGDKIFIDKFTQDTHLNYFPLEFIKMCNEDQLGNLIRNVDIWVKDIFQDLLAKK
jgi:hypothetical protein